MPFSTQRRVCLPLPFADLTQRERELLELIAQGHDNDDIARRAGVSNKTVRNHITRIFSKLQVETRAQAIVRAREVGMGVGNAASRVKER